jgi:hypothetical protein
VSGASISAIEGGEPYVLCPYVHQVDVRTDRERLRRVAERQAGNVSRGQLLALGLARGAIESGLRIGRFVEVLPRVYRLGHRAPSRQGDLWASVLYAGPGAMLSHATAAQWRGLIDYPPKLIEVSTPRKIDSQPGVRVYGRRRLDRSLSNGIPVTSIPQTALDLAAVADFKLVRKALARLDYHHQLDLAALDAICGHGKPGSAALRRALAIHQPRLARTNSPLEDDFLVWCEQWKVPLPRVNVRVHRVLVDAYWPEHGVVVELDGADNHSSPAQRRRDRANELTLRSHGLVVLRYDWDLVHGQPRIVYDDLMAALKRAR